MKWIARIFGRQVVHLVDHDGVVTARWAKPTPRGLSCRRFLGLRHTQCLLLADGSVIGPRYVSRWSPAP